MLLGVHVQTFECAKHMYEEGGRHLALAWTLTLILNEVHIISRGDNWYFSDSNWIGFQFNIHEIVIVINMKMVPIISFSIEA